MLKRKFLLSIVVTFLVMIGLTACGTGSGNGSEETKNESSESKIKDNLTIFGGSVGGVWSIFTEGVSEAVRKEYPGTHISAVPGTVAGNAVAVSQGKTDFAISESLTANFAYEGTQSFDEAHENIRAVAAIMPINVFQLVAPVDADFDTVEDIAANDIGIHYSAGEKDALGDIVSASVFEAYDLSYEDIAANGGEVDFLSGGKTFELMADERIDSLGKMVPIPAGDILEASATIDMKLIPIGEKAIEHLSEKFQVKPYTIPAGSYDFQTEDYETINTPTILITNEEMDDETVYHVTKALYNQLDYLANVHNGFSEVNEETIVDVGNVPLHPGAEKFFKEEGLME